MLPRALKAYRGILWGGLVAGVLDISYAFVLSGLRGRSPVWVLQSVASGLLGARSYQSGAAAAVLGAFAHLFIATTWAAVYFLASRRLPSLVQHPVLCGLVYGIAVYLFMNFVVIPLSAISIMPNYPPAALLRGVLGIMVFVGLPIALINRRYSGGRQPGVQTIATAVLLTIVCLFDAVSHAARAQTRSPIPAGIHSRSVMTMHATGSFDVTVSPQAPPEQAEGIALGRMSIDKQYHGDLDATSTGEMLTAASDSNGSAVYVAIERVTGTLHGHRGSFVLMHNGTMTRDAQHLSVTVAPGSGTAQLVGLGGTMAITIVDKKHLYDFEYTLDKSP